MTQRMKTNVPHVEWVDLHNDGIAHEVVIMSENKSNGDIYYISTQDLDNIDKARLMKILRRKDAAKYPLWDLMSQETLKNGVNALDLFHQLVKIRTVGGKILNVGSGRMGAPVHFTQQPVFKAPQPTDTGDTAKPKKKGE